jgi:flagellar hook protein FlgE
MAVGSFSSALSGLDANSTALGVIGNNLANINTVGFKASTVSFEDLVSQSVGGTSDDPMQVGLGVTTGAISPTFTQGSIENTGVATNVAIQGNGFFVVSGPDGQSYTRDGDFSFNSNGALVTPDGQTVQGYTTLDASGNVVTTGTPTNIIVPPGELEAPVATTNFTAMTNLDASAAATATFSSSVQVFDAQGTAHVMTITYTKTAANTWTYAITAPGADVTGGTSGTPFAITQADGGTGTLVFDTSGNLLTVNGNKPADVKVTTPTWTDGAAASSLTWNLLDPTTGSTTVTGYSATSATSSITQNGSAAGAVDAVSITSDGSIMATFGAGQSVTIGKIALAVFDNPQGLVKLGDNCYGSSESAGQANIGAAGTGGRGTLIGSALEESNVDMAQEFTNMILSQRGYEANAKSITTADQMLQDTLNLKQ